MLCSSRDLNKLSCCVIIVVTSRLEGEAIAADNVVKYVEEKYGFTPEVKSTVIGGLDSYQHEKYRRRFLWSFRNLLRVL